MTQEIALARHAIVIAGSEAVELNIVVRAIQMQDSPFQYIADYILEHKRESSITSERSLLNLLYHFRSTGCANFRDRIYSLLALCREGESFRVDYNVSDEEVMRYTLRVCSDSLCLCSAAIITDALSLPPRLFVEMASYIEVPVTSARIRYIRCMDCGSICPFTHHKMRGTIFCLRKTCKGMRIHLLWDPYHRRVCLPHGHPNTSDGIEMKDLELVGDGTKATLRFSFGALVNLVQGASGELMKECKKIWHVQRTPGMRREDRPRFC